MVGKDADLGHLKLSLVILGGASILVSALFGGFFVKGALVQVKDVTAAAYRISAGDLKARVPLRGTGDEIDNLAQIINRMLARIELLVSELTEVVDNIAHELRSPLTCLRGNCELVLARSDAGIDCHVLAEDVLEDADRLLLIINDMLEITELVSSTARLQLAKVNLTEVILETIDLFRPIADERQIGLIFDSQTPTYVEVDRQKLQRVFFNLFDNGIKYNRDGGEVRVQVKESAASYVISIADTGVGVGEDEAAHVFERFYRGRKVRHLKGTGMGLSLVRAVIEAHEGTIKLEPGLNEGVRVEIVLPKQRSLPETRSAGSGKHVLG